METSFSFAVVWVLGSGSRHTGEWGAYVWLSLSSLFSPLVLHSDSKLASPWQLPDSVSRPGWARPACEASCALLPGLWETAPYIHCGVVLCYPSQAATESILQISMDKTFKGDTMSQWYLINQASGRLHASELDSEDYVCLCACVCFRVYVCACAYVHACVCTCVHSVYSSNAIHLIYSGELI